MTMFEISTYTVQPGRVVEVLVAGVAYLYSEGEVIQMTPAQARQLVANGDVVKI